MNYLSLFSGIGGFDLRHHSSGFYKLFLRYQTSVREAVAVGTQNHSIFYCKFAAIRFVRDMVRITWSFVPATTHTLIGEGSSECFIPSTPIGVCIFTLVCVAFSLIPRFSGFIRERIKPSFDQLFRAVAFYKKPWPAVFVKFVPRLTATTFTQYSFQFNLLVVGINNE